VAGSVIALILEERINFNGSITKAQESFRKASINQDALISPSSDLPSLKSVKLNRFSVAAAFGALPTLCCSAAAIRAKMSMSDHQDELHADPRVRAARTKLATDEGYVQWMQRLNAMLIGMYDSDCCLAGRTRSASINLASLLLFLRISTTAASAGSTVETSSMQTFPPEIYSNADWLEYSMADIEPSTLVGLRRQRTALIKHLNATNTL
jgi:hypothetical protein